MNITINLIYITCRAQSHWLLFLKEKMQCKALYTFIDNGTVGELLIL